MLNSNLTFVSKSHGRKFKITNIGLLIKKSPLRPFKIDMSQQDNDFEDPKFTLKILKYVTTKKNGSSLLYLFHLICAPFFVIIYRGVEQ